MRIIGAVIAVLAISTGGAKAQSDWTTVEAKGKWQYMSKIDGFSDERRCVLLYDGDPEIQYSRGILAISFSRYAGLKDFQIRIDDGPIIEMRPSEYDKENGLVVVEGDELQKVLDSKRLRVRVTTTREGVKQRDLDMTGLKEVRSRFVTDCPND